MDHFDVICGLIGAICGLIPTIVALVVLIKNIIKNKNWDLVVQIAQSAMTTVEEYAKEHTEMTSEDKLNMALEAIESGCEAAGIDFDADLVLQIKAYIEEMCAWSKTVNVEESSDSEAE